jgi:hypothetical protein
MPSVRKQLLGVTRISDRLAFLRITVMPISKLWARRKLRVLEFDMTQSGVRDITDENPSNFENTFPLV